MPYTYLLARKATAACSLSSYVVYSAASFVDTRSHFYYVMAKKAEVKTSKKKAKPAPKVGLLDGNFNVCCRSTVRANK